ncbi:alpha-hydroxy acid oxidase [Trebonia sp.]|uniref:alpha-hydroxy acid oxidase n=1 Tax=Trebonia sp. TaxID=2767075 RepID=UPI002608AC5E|nr:alpha-hydroxy acid oxidase [Trebonia sp.]
MRVQEMRKLVRLRAVELDGTRRRLAACHDVSDLRRVAKRRIPRPVFDYVDGAADEELAVAANVAAFRQWRFLPRVLADVDVVDMSATVLGSALPVPLALGPAGYTRMLHPDGESGAARSAARHGLPYTLSTMAATGIEELAAVAVAGGGSGGAAVAGGAAAGRPDLWFQLYILKDRSQARDLVSRAADNGFGALVVTVDTVVAGNRLRDQRNGLSIPPELSLHTVASVASKPGYWLRLLSGPALDYANFAGRPPTTIRKTADFFDASIDWSDIADLRSRWAGKLIIKGPLGPTDARRAAELGVDGIQLSNHGGRQLDRTVAPADLIAPVREAVGPSVALLVDSGIRHGADVVVALALGADAGVLGRAYLYGLMAGGEAGVDRALDLITRQFRTTMQLLGVTSVAELRKRGRELITREPR